MFLVPIPRTSDWVRSFLFDKSFDRLFDKTSAQTALTRSPASDVAESDQAYTVTLDLPGVVWIYAALLATGCTVLPVFLVAEALKRIGANHFALIGALGPVTTVLADFVLLEGALTALQLAGGGLVISGVLLVTIRKG